MWLSLFLAGKAVAFAEMLEFGKQHAERVITNAKAPGQALYERDLTVLMEHKGFTESHQIVSMSQSTVWRGHGEGSGNS